LDNEDIYESTNIMDFGEPAGGEDGLSGEGSEGLDTPHNGCSSENYTKTNPMSIGSEDQWVHGFDSNNEMNVEMNIGEVSDMKSGLFIGDVDAYMLSNNSVDDEASLGGISGCFSLNNTTYL
jgi:hypothetical protein